MRLGTLVRLLLASLVVGFVLTWLDLDPMDLVDRAQAALGTAFDLGRNLLGGVVTSAGDLVGLVLVGAVVVVPIWLLSTLLSALRRRRNRQ